MSTGVSFKTDNLGPSCELRPVLVHCKPELKSETYTVYQEIFSHTVLQETLHHLQGSFFQLQFLHQFLFHLLSPITGYRTNFLKVSLLFIHLLTGVPKVTYGKWTTIE